MGTPLNLSLARAKLYGAITEQAGSQRQPFALRPSNIGQCPLRLWFAQEDAKQGLDFEERLPRNVWSAFQGSVNEELMRALLRAAGAEIIEPPEESDVWMENIEPDPETGFKPHLDGLIRWPEIGLTEWAVLECKNMRVFGHLALLWDGLFADRTYWYQAVSYLRLAPLAIQHYAEFEHQYPGPDAGAWIQMYEERVVPAGIFFMSTAKDPATSNLQIQQQLKAPMYETEPPKKGWNDKQLAQMHIRQAKRERYEEAGSDPAFYFEYVERNDLSVLETWDDIINVKRQVELSPRPEPLYNIAVADDDLPTECRWYCQYLERHRMMGFTLLPGEQAATAAPAEEEEIA